jgi:hypothetical protein
MNQGHQASLFHIKQGLGSGNRHLRFATRRGHLREKKDNPYRRLWKWIDLWIPILLVIKPHECRPDPSNQMGNTHPNIQHPDQIRLRQGLSPCPWVLRMQLRLHLKFVDLASRCSRLPPDLAVHQASIKGILGTIPLGLGTRQRVEEVAHRYIMPHLAALEIALCRHH